ncbi:MAG: ACT domain-containing protein [Boseongicola sp.]
MSEDSSDHSNLVKTTASLAPVLQPGTFVFCSVFHNADAGEAMSVAVGSFVEDEGLSLIMPRTEAVRLGLIFDLTMRQITLMVYSQLDGIGLSATVAGALAEKGIPANIVAATQHDHIFVPSRQADAAMEVLKGLQQAAQDQIS